MGPYGYNGRSLWLLVISPDDRAQPAITEITDVDEQPDARAREGWARILGQLVGPGERAAFLVSRPGRDGLTSSDRAWAAVLYAACRQAGVTSETVHRANDAGVRPVTLDDLAQDLED